MNKSKVYFVYRNGEGDAPISDFRTARRYYQLAKDDPITKKGDVIILESFDQTIDDEYLATKIVYKKTI